MQLHFIKIISGGLAAAALIFALSGCGKKPAPKQPPIQVSVVSVHSGSVPITYEYPGRVAGYRETEVRARVGGLLLKRNFVEGSKVKEGQLLFQIDPSVYEAEVARQKGLLAAAKASYAQAIRDADRAQELWKQKYQSTAYRDQMVATRDADAAAVQQAEAQLKQAELNLEYTQVTAPIGGITGKKAVDEGSLITTDSTGNLLTTITQTDPVYINFSYAGSDARNIRRIREAMRARSENADNLRVQVRFGDGRLYDKAGAVDFTSPNIDPDTGALGVRAIVANPDDALTPGEFVRLILEGLEVDNMISIPEQALMQNSQGQFVYVVNAAGEVEMRPVVALRQLDNRDWLIERGAEQAPPAQTDQFREPDEKAPAPVKNFVGLRDGERVITEGQFRIGNALAAMPAGVRLKVDVTEIDGRPAGGAGGPGSAAGQKPQ